MSPSSLRLSVATTYCTHSMSPSLPLAANGVCCCSVGTTDQFIECLLELCKVWSLYCWAGGCVLASPYRHWRISTTMEYWHTLSQCSTLPPLCYGSMRGHLCRWTYSESLVEQQVLLCTIALVSHCTTVG